MQRGKRKHRRRGGGRETNFLFFVVSSFLFRPSTFLHTTHSPSSLTSLYFVVDIHQSPSRSSSISSDLPIAFIIPSKRSSPQQQAAKSSSNSNNNNTVTTIATTKKPS
jgi:hypothetical protein